MRSQTDTDSPAPPPPKRTPMTKNAGHGEKRKRNISGSSLPLVKKEPIVELNDEVSAISLWNISI